MRDLHPDFSAELSNRELFPVQLVACEFDPEPAYFWGGLGTLSYNGRNYFGLGGAASAENVQETSEVQASSVSLSVKLKKEEEQDMAWLRNLRARGKEVVITDALLDKEDLSIIATDTAFRGAAGEPSLRIGPKFYELSIVVVNELESLKKTYGLTHSNADQQRLYPGDTSHRFIPFFQDLDFRI